jgi:CheY-like chemotaxis protein
MQERINILVVEECKVDRRIIVGLLNRLGFYEIGIAKDGLTAYTKICNDENEYDLVFLSTDIPIIDGITVAKKIRDDTKKRAFIVAVTTDVSDETIKKCVDAGMDAYISKPISINELESMLNMFIEKHSN